LIDKKSKSLIQHGFDTKSVEYKLLMRTGTHAKGGINNQSLITGFSIRFIQQQQFQIQNVARNTEYKTLLPCSSPSKIKKN